MFSTFRTWTRDSWRCPGADRSGQRGQRKGRGYTTRLRPGEAATGRRGCSAPDQQERRGAGSPVSSARVHRRDDRGQGCSLFVQPVDGRRRSSSARAEDLNVRVLRRSPFGERRPRPSPRGSASAQGRAAPRLRGSTFRERLRGGWAAVARLNRRRRGVVLQPSPLGSRATPPAPLGIGFCSFSR